MAADQKKPGYDDTPILPGAMWKVHDSARPHPRVVTPGTESTQAQAGSAPSDAIILFDGTSLAGWENLKGEAAGWKVENGYMEAVPKTGNIRTKAQLGDCQLHLEMMAPIAVEGESQGRGNSGVFMQGIYEIQVLDNYQNPTYADGHCAAIYGQYPPLVNACRPPGQWQTYDVIWEVPLWIGDKLVKPAYCTVLLNGVLVHHRVELMGPTGHRNVYAWKKHEPAGPLMLQDHSNPVRFRNIWYRPLKGYDE